MSPTYLDNNRNTETTDTRLDRYDVRRLCQMVTHNARLRECGSKRIGSGPVGILRTASGYGATTSISTCRSQTCGVCAPRLATKQAARLGRAIGNAHARGWGVSFHTLTVPRTPGSMEFGEVYDRVQKVWSAAFRGKAADEWRAVTSYRAQVRSVETTFTLDDRDYSAHIHVHAVLFWSQPLDEHSLFAAHVGLWSRFSKAAVHHGFNTPRIVASDVQVVDGDGLSIGRYVAAVEEGVERTWSLSDEVTGGSRKWNLSSLTPLQVGALAGETGLLAACRAWWSWEKGVKGRKPLSWSRGLADELDVEVETSDEETIEEDNEDATLVAFVEPRAWDTLRRAGQHLALLRAVRDRDATWLTLVAVASPWLGGEGIHPPEWDEDEP